MSASVGQDNQCSLELKDGGNEEAIRDSFHSKTRESPFNRPGSFAFGDRSLHKFQTNGTGTQKLPNRKVTFIGSKQQGASSQNRRGSQLKGSKFEEFAQMHKR